MAVLGAVGFTGDDGGLPPAASLAPRRRGRGRATASSTRVRGNSSASESSKQQFPDSLDMLNRALRAGLALNGAIQIVADESPDPVAQGVQGPVRGKPARTRHEGSTQETRGPRRQHGAAGSSSRRSSSRGRPAVTSRRFSKGRRRSSATASEFSATSGRLPRRRVFPASYSPCLPIVMAALIYFVAPEYLKGLVVDPIGRVLIVAAVSLQVIGFLVIRRIINIKV